MLPHSSLGPSSPLANRPVPPSPTPARSGFVALPSAGATVDARQHVEPGTGAAFVTALVIMFMAIGVAGFVLFGALMGASTAHNSQGPRTGPDQIIASILPIVIVALVLVVGSIYAKRRAKAILRASSLRVGPRQFSELHNCANEYAQRLGLAETPEMFVIDADSVNAFALKFGRRDTIVLTDEAVAACLEGRSPGALAFVVGHELAHVALGHTRWWRMPLRRFHQLTRLDECSADNVACELVGSREAAVDGILLLTAGPRLLSYVDRSAALEQASEIAADRATLRAERSLTHPLTLRRLNRIDRRFEARSGARLAA